MDKNKARLGMKECNTHQVIRSLGLITKKDPVFRIKGSVYILPNNVYVLSGKSNIISNIDSIETNSEFIKIFNQDPKFNKRYVDIDI